MGSSESTLEREERTKKAEQDHDLQMKQADLELKRIGVAAKVVDLEMKKVDAESKRVELDAKKDIAALNVRIKLEERKVEDEVLRLMKKHADLESELKELETNPNHVTISAKEEEIVNSKSSERACIIEGEGHEDNFDKLVEEFVSKTKQRVRMMSD